jgi:hypothetical protein
MMTVTIDSEPTNTKGTSDMTVTIDSETTTVDRQYADMMATVTTLRRLTPDTAKARTTWARFDAIAGNRWFDDKTWQAMGEYGKRRNYDWDRPALALSLRDDQGRAWWTNSYVLVGEHGTSDAWSIPAVRGEDNLIDLTEWLTAAGVAAIVRRGCNPMVAATTDAIKELTGMLTDEYGVDRDLDKARDVLGSMYGAVEAVAPNTKPLTDGVTIRDNRRVIVGRLIPSDTGDQVMMVDYATGEDVALVNANYLASFTKGATFMAATGDNGALKPIGVWADDKLVGIIMPIRLHGASPDVRNRFMLAVKDVLASKLWGQKATTDKATPEMWSALNDLSAQVRVP